MVETPEDATMGEIAMYVVILIVLAGVAYGIIKFSAKK